MRRVVFVSMIALLALDFAVSSYAAPGAPPQVLAAKPAITPVQGWWEQEHQSERARGAYWRLPPPALERYNRLQFQINQLTAQRDQIDDQIRHAVREQRELLGFDRR